MRKSVLATASDQLVQEQQSDQYYGRGVTIYVGRKTYRELSLTLSQPDAEALKALMPKPLRIQTPSAPWYRRFAK